MRKTIIPLASYQVGAHWVRCGDCGGWLDPWENVDRSLSPERPTSFYAPYNAPVVDGGVICHNCLQFRDSSVCSDCNDVFNNADLIECGGKLYCFDCQLANDIESCDNCDHYDDLNDLIYIDGDYFCNDCVDNLGYTVCVGCAEYYNENLHLVDCDVYCQGCFFQNYKYCEECNDPILNEDIIEVDECYYCNSCAPEVGSTSWVGCAKYDKVGSDRKYGVELETNFCHNHNDFNSCAWRTVSEPSVSGWEFVSVILNGNDGLSAIHDICNFAAKNSWDVRNNCGYHLHIDIQGESSDNLKAIALAYHTTHDLWKDCVKNHRHDESYCCSSRHELGDFISLNSSSDWKNFASRLGRYDWANWNAYSKHGSLEIRLHEGTLDGSEVCNWVRAHTTFVDWAVKVGYDGVRKALWGRTTSEQLAALWGVWSDAGCGDLTEFYSSKELVYA